MGAGYRFRASRHRGFRKPRRGLVVARRAHFGNPFRVENYGHEQAVRLRRAALLYGTLRSPIDGRRITCDDVRRELAGRPLGCYCRLDQPCHADTLLEIANRRERCAIGSNELASSSRAEHNPEAFMSACHRQLARTDFT
jgi:hypothetical protein